MARFGNDALQLLGTPGIVIGGVTNFSESTNTNLITPDSGTPSPTVAPIASQKPEMDFTSHDVRTFLQNIGFWGACIDTGQTITGLKGFQLRRDNCGPKGRSAANHKEGHVRKGHIVLSSVTMPADGVGAVVAKVHATYDGTNAPITYAYNATAPTKPADAETRTYHLGGIKIGGVLYDIINMSLTYNSTIEKPIKSGPNVWPTIVDVQRVTGTASFTFEDSELVTSIAGADITHANTEFWFLDHSQAVGASAHIKGTLAGKAYVSGSTASGAGAASNTLEVTLVDGATAPIVWAFDQAYVAPS